MTPWDAEVMARTLYGEMARCPITGVLSPRGWKPEQLEWKACSRSADYEVSEFGHIRRATPGKGTWAGRLLRTKAHHFGYRRVGLCIDGRCICFEVHALVAEAFLGPKPEAGHEVAHFDGNPEHNHHRNLSWKTHHGNVQDGKRHGTTPQGERNAMAKLTAGHVREIRAAYPERSLSQIAALYRIAPQTVSRIINRQRWEHVA